ncbi:hypothetical protein JD844_012824 [Phrynosoma platyrhinos]|uniref:STAS domain-containing protein n=1 Tax=Phrynosoma platyrhinos TaxID=52577 RepID=A0ABQ7TK14_PHRPL|nr:hypothetical protein JD844_012824 [Phrynosoma platyrhinos]
MTDSLEPSGKYMKLDNVTNDTIVNEAERDAARVQLVAAITFLVGIFQIGLGLLQFGFLATYLSEPLVRAYTTAAAIQVLISQLKYIIGVDIEEYAGPLALIYTFLELCSKLPKTNVGTLITSLVAMASIVIVKIINDKLGKRLPVPLPIELLTIIVSTGISYGAKLNERFMISVVGDIPNGLIPPKAPNINYFGQVIGNAFAIAVVSYVICISLGKIFALKHGYKVDSNQELIALGLSNFMGGFFQCYSISCSMSRSLVQENTGGHSQVAALVSCLIILVTILKVSELFRELPKAILAAIILVNLKATILLNLDIGLGVAVVFSLLTVIFRTQMPHYSILGQVSRTGIYKDVAEYQKAEEIPGVKIFRSSATVYFANAALYEEALKKKCGFDVEHLIKKKKKALKKKQNKDKKEEKKMKKIASVIKKTHDSGTNNLAFIDIDVEAKSQEPGGDTTVNGPNGTVKDWRSQNHNQQESCYQFGLKALGLEKPPFHSIILDFSPVNFVDTVCIKTLKNIFRDFQEIEVDVFLVGCNGKEAYNEYGLQCSEQARISETEMYALLVHVKA